METFIAACGIIIIANIILWAWVLSETQSDILSDLAKIKKALNII